MNNFRSKFALFRGLLLARLLGFIAYLLGYKLPPILSVCGIILKDKKILGVNLTYQKGYALPGGMVEENETLEEALRREIFEETGLEVIKAEYLGSYNIKKETLFCYLYLFSH